MVVQQCTYFVYIYWKKGIFSEASSLTIFSTHYDSLRSLHLCVFSIFFLVEAIFQILLAVMRGKLRPISDIF